MEVKNERAALLSNYEVYTLLKDIQTGQNGQQKPGSNQKNLATISYETLQYLKGTPCKDQSPEIISQLMTALAPYGLTKAEKLQILNLRPTTAVEIQLIVEESEERLTVEQIEELIEVVNTYLPGNQVTEDMESGNWYTSQRVRSDEVWRVPGLANRARGL